MDSNKLWALFWILITVTILGTVATMGGCVYKTNENNTKVVSEAIQKGIDPILAKCAAMLGSNVSANSSLGTAETAICLTATSKSK